MPRRRRRRRPEAHRRRGARLRRLRRALPAGSGGQLPGAEGSRGEDQFAVLAALLPGFTAVPGIAVDASRPTAARRTFGNMILSRCRCGRSAPLLPWPRIQPCAACRASLVEALVDAPFGPLRIMTTHLEYYSPTQRAAQVEAVRARHAEACAHAFGRASRDTRTTARSTTSRRRVSTILTGDFNFARRRSAARAADGAVRRPGRAGSRGRVAATACRCRAAADGRRARSSRSGRSRSPATSCSPAPICAAACSTSRSTRRAPRRTISRCGSSSASVATRAQRPGPRPIRGPTSVQIFVRVRMKTSVGDDYADDILGVREPLS